MTLASSVTPLRPRATAIQDGVRTARRQPAGGGRATPSLPGGEAKGSTIGGTGDGGNAAIFGAGGAGGTVATEADAAGTGAGTGAGTACAPDWIDPVISSR